MLNCFFSDQIYTQCTLHLLWLHRTFSQYCTFTTSVHYSHLPTQLLLPKFVAHSAYLAFPEFTKNIIVQVRIGLYKTEAFLRANRIWEPQSGASKPWTSAISSGVLQMGYQNPLLVPDWAHFFSRNWKGCTGLRKWYCFPCKRLSFTAGDDISSPLIGNVLCYKSVFFK